MRIATMWKPVALLDLGLRPLNNVSAVNSTQRLAERVRAITPGCVPPPPLDLPAFLRKQAD